VLSTACKLKLEQNELSDRGKGFCVVKSMQIETEKVWDIRHGKGAF
jgi:hypothetical protein